MSFTILWRILKSGRNTLPQVFIALFLELRPLCSIHHFRSAFLRHILNSHICIEANIRLSSFRTFSLNKYYTKSCTGTIQRSCSCIFKYSHWLYLIRINIIDITHNRKSIHYIKRIWSCRKWCSSTNTDVHSLSWYSRSLIHLYTCNLSLHLLGRKFIKIQCFHSTSNSSFGLGAISYHYYFIQRLHIFFQDNAQWMIVFQFDFLRNISCIAELKYITHIRCQREITIKICYGTLTRSFYQYRNTY